MGNAQKGNGVKLELELGTHLCYAKKFAINAVTADTHDFGDQGDRSPERADDYCCDDMHFTPKPPSPEVLAKYGINAAEYALVAGQLEAGLSFGNCGLCS